MTSGNSWRQQPQTKRFFEGLGDLLVNYQRPDIVSLLTPFWTLGEAVRQIKRLADQAEHITGSLKGIDQNLRSINVQGDYFPQYVYSYTRRRIEEHTSDTVPHYFAVFNKST
jgi:hypothetical protein